MATRQQQSRIEHQTPHCYEQSDACTPFADARAVRQKKSTKGVFKEPSSNTRNRARFRGSESCCSLAHKSASSRYQSVRCYGSLARLPEPIAPIVELPLTSLENLNRGIQKFNVTPESYSYHNSCELGTSCRDQFWSTGKSGFRITKATSDMPGMRFRGPVSISICCPAAPL